MKLNIYCLGFEFEGHSASVTLNPIMELIPDKKRGHFVVEQRCKVNNPEPQSEHFFVVVVVTKHTHPREKTGSES